MTEGCTIQNLLEAQGQLVGGLHATHACDRFGVQVPFSHVLTGGQVICIHCEEFDQCPAPAGVSIVAGWSGSEMKTSEVLASDGVNMQCPVANTVSPTALWTIPAHEVYDEPRFGPFDAGECACLKNLCLTVIPGYLLLLCLACTQINSKVCKYR